MILKKKNTLHFWYFFTLSSILCEYLSRRKLDKIESTRSGQSVFEFNRKFKPKGIELR